MGATGTLKARCPYCFSYVRLRDEVEVWDLVTCRECESALQVVNLHPPELDYLDEAPYEDDWEGDWQGHQFSVN